MQRKILWDLLRIFAITLIGLTGLFLLGGMVAEASQHGLAPGQLFRLLPLMIPSMLPYTIPAATLFATCNVYGRLAKDNEITALRAAGVNLLPVLLPSLLLGFAGSGLTLGLYYRIIPRSFQLVREHLLDNPNELLLMMLKRNGCIKNKNLDYVLFAREVRGERLIDAIFKHKLALPAVGYDSIVRAKDATLRVESYIDPATREQINEVVVTLNNCVVSNEVKKGSSPATVMVRSQVYRERLKKGGGVFDERETVRSSDVAWPELLKRTAVLRERERLRDEKIKHDAALVDTMTETQKKEFLDSQGAQKYKMREFRSFEAEVQMRPALSLGCLCFVLIGGPIGIWTNRADFLSSFVIGFLPAVMLYYPMVICGTNLGKDGRLPMPVAVWTADVVFLIIAVAVCVRVVRR
jgi:lipopolysaccharide export system permease protein